MFSSNFIFDKIQEMSRTDRIVLFQQVDCGKIQPSFYYLDWLAKLLAKEEGSFLGYQAAIALSNAVDVLKECYSAELKTAIKLAQVLGKYFYGDNILEKPSFQVLKQAETKLEESTN